MKAINLTLILLTVATFTQGQGVWSPTGATWHYSYSNNFAVTGYIEIKYVGDSLVGGKMTKVLRKVRNWYNNSTTNSGVDTLGYEYTYLSNDTVYYFRHGQFFPLYVFNSNPNDYWTIAGWNEPNSCDSIGETLVDSIGTTTINTFSLKYLKVSPKDTSDWQFGFGATLVERIGCTNCYMFPEPLSCMLDANEGGQFRCYSDSAFGLYESGTVAVCDFITGIKPLSEGNKGITIYPNPATKEINIIIKDLGTDQYVIDIYSALGQCIKTMKTSEVKTKIDTDGLTEGIYLISIVDRKARRWTKKLKINAL